MQMTMAYPEILRPGWREGGWVGANSLFSGKNLLFCKDFLPKLHENERNWMHGGEGGMHTLLHL